MIAALKKFMHIYWLITLLLNMITQNLKSLQKAFLFPDEIIKKLNLYKLRSQIEITKNQNLFVIFNTQSLGFIDARAKDFGFR